MATYRPPLSSTSAAAPAPAAMDIRVEQMQRTRLLAGAARAIDEHGYARVTVAEITRRAGVSRRTFYEIFTDREKCSTAVIEDAVRTLVAELRHDDPKPLSWRERIRAGLTAILAFLDREPLLARICVVQALQAGPSLQVRREEILAGLAAVVDEGRSESARGKTCTPLTAEGLVGAAFAIVHARLQRGEHQPLAGLANELMAMIVLPYLGPAAARREQTRPLPAVSRRPTSSVVADDAYPSLMGAVGLRFTYRTARVLCGIHEHPCASNRKIAEHADVVDAAQISRLLGRLERAGLITNTRDRRAKGESNAWQLTARGEQVVHSIRVQNHHGVRAA
jgi:AcrR family transcriptional regulator/DNA-binding MarR family transcriptional regulator